MALELKIKTCITNGCKTINFYETTGEEGASNLTGWGLDVGPTNPQITDAVGTPTVTITSTAFSGSVVIDVTGFPKKDPTILFEIEPSDLSASWKLIQDGHYRFVYEVNVTVGGASKTYSTSYEKMFYCNAKCCVDKLAANIGDVAKCGCSTNEAEDKFMTAYTLYKGVVNQARKLNYTGFAKTIKNLNKLCSKADCGCGCN